MDSMIKGGDTVLAPDSMGAMVAHKCNLGFAAPKVFAGDQGSPCPPHNRDTCISQGFTWLS
jgi:hypothetical protein